MLTKQVFKHGKISRHEIGTLVRKDHNLRAAWRIYAMDYLD